VSNRSGSPWRANANQLLEVHADEWAPCEHVDRDNSLRGELFSYTLEAGGIIRTGWNVGVGDAGSID
jgi:hypothetical protein